jgi:hypothetical protein
MKTSAFVLLLSLLANLSFTSLSGMTAKTQAYFEYMDTVSRDGLTTSLFGDWTNIGQDKPGSGMASLSLHANGKFNGMTAEGKKICGNWEVSTDTLSLVLHKVCEKTGKKETVIAKAKLMDGHLLTLEMPADSGGKQMFIQ